MKTLITILLLAVIVIAGYFLQRITNGTISRVEFDLVVILGLVIYWVVPIRPIV